MLNRLLVYKPPDIAVNFFSYFSLQIDKDGFLKAVNYEFHVLSYFVVIVFKLFGGCSFTDIIV